MLLNNFKQKIFLLFITSTLFAQIEDKFKQLDQEIAEVKADFTGGDVSLAVKTIEDEKNHFIKSYTRDLEELSHGEAFLKFFNTRITGKGLYLIDEPEAPKK